MAFNVVRLAIDIKDEFSSLVCIGVFTMITFHTFKNIGMTIGLLPIIGIPSLPFISFLCLKHKYDTKPGFAQSTPTKRLMRLSAKTIIY
nr:FtsW/RodA/SpoVE family cell cycle protein [Metabacillus malikii]